MSSPTPSLLLVLLFVVACEPIGSLVPSDDTGVILVDTAPQNWIVYGSSLESAFLRGKADLFIQPVNEHGQNMSTQPFAHLLSVAIDPPPSEQSLRLLPSGAVHLSFIWRQTGEADIRIQVGGTHVADSPYSVFVEEEFSIDIRGDAILEPIALPNASAQST